MLAALVFLSLTLLPSCSHSSRNHGELCAPSKSGPETQKADRPAGVTPMLMSPLRYLATRKSPEPRPIAQFSASLDSSRRRSIPLSSASLWSPSSHVLSTAGRWTRAARLVHNREYRFIARSWNCAPLSPHARKIRERRLRSLVTERTDYKSSLTYRKRKYGMDDWPS